MTDEELFPAEVLYKDIKEKHPEYDAATIDRYDCLYAGGPKFKANIEKYEFLDKRQLDGATDGALARPRLDTQDPDKQLSSGYKFQGLSRWDAKKKVARYTNYVAGMIDYFVQGVFKEEPELVGTSAHWAQLKSNADGNGNSLAAILRGCLRDTLIWRRAYLSNYVPEVQAANRAEQRAAGGLTPRLDWLSAADVDMWDCNKNKLLWVRTYRADAVRTKPFGQPDQKRMLWTYITAKNIIEYEIVYAPDKPPEDATVIQRKSLKPHGFKSLPVIPIQISADLWAMQRLEDPCLALYNREVAMTCLINDAAFQILTIATGEQPDSVPDMSMGALWVGLNGKAEMVGPQGSAFDAQRNDCLLKKNNLYEVFNAMGINALATQTQNARQSDAAKARDKEPLYALMVTFGYAMRSALEASGQLQAEFIDEPEPPQCIWNLRGMNDIDLKEKFQNLLYAQDVQGFSDTARRQMLQDAALNSCPDANGKIKAAIIDECAKADLEPPEPIASIPETPTGPIPRETGETADGFVIPKEHAHLFEDDAA